MQQNDYLRSWSGENKQYGNLPFPSRNHVDIKRPVGIHDHECRVPPAARYAANTLAR